MNYTNMYAYMAIQMMTSSDALLLLFMLIVKIMSGYFVSGKRGGKIKFLIPANNLFVRTMLKFRWNRCRVELFDHNYKRFYSNLHLMCGAVVEVYRAGILVASIRKRPAWSIVCHVPIRVRSFIQPFCFT